jgi:hypothetical protein
MHVAKSIASSSARVVDRWALERAKRRSRAFSASRSPNRADLKGRHPVPPRTTPKGGSRDQKSAVDSSARPERTKSISTTTQGRNGDSEFGQARRPDGNALLEHGAAMGLMGRFFGIEDRAHRLPDLARCLLVSGPGVLRARGPSGGHRTELAIMEGMTHRAG